MKHRRRVPRQPASWEGNCHIEGEFPARSRACRIIDISMLGLGMTLEHSSPSELLGRRISVDVPAVSDSVSIRLEGVVNNAVPMLEGVVRVGIAFDGLAAGYRHNPDQDEDRSERWLSPFSS
jgi:PilZ domain